MTDDERYFMMIDEIEQLKAENKQLQAQITAKETTLGGTYIDINTHFRDIEKLQSENTCLKAERDKAIEDIYHIHCAGRYGCIVCFNNDLCKRQNTHIGKCEDFTWRGLEEIK